MLVKKILLLLLSGFFLTYYSPGHETPAKKSKTDEKIDRLLKELKDSEQGPDRADILHALSKTYISFDQEKARNYAKQQVELSKKINYQKGIAYGLNTIGNTYMYQGKFTQAQEYYFKSLEIREEMGHKPGIASVLNNIGYTYWYLGDYNQALEYNFKSLKIRKEIGDKKMIARSYNSIAIVYRNQSNYSKALEYHFYCLKLKEELGDKSGMAISYNNIGVLYLDQSNYSKASEYYFKSLKLNQELGNKNRMAASYNNIGIIYNIQRKFKKALDYFNKSLKIKEEIGDKPGIAQTFNNMGSIYYEQKEFDRALDYWSRAKTIFKEMGLKKGLIDAYIGAGKCYKDKNQLQKAVADFNLGLNLARDIGNQKSISEAAGELAGIYAQTGQYKKAYQFHVLFKEKNDGLKNKENTEKITRLEMQYEFGKKQKQMQMEQHKKSLVKEAELKQQRLLKYTFSTIAILLALLFYTRYRLKVKVNRLLRKEIRDRKYAEAELVKSMKLETVGILSAGIAHDFNNLLAVIAGNLEMARSTLQDPYPQPVSFIQSAEKATNQTAELVKKFLTISEGGWIMRDKVTLPDVLSSAMESSPILRQMPLANAMPGNLKPLFGDERQLRQVMVNLLLNAHEATSGMDKDKKTCISAENLSLPANNPWKLSEGEYLKVSVTDNGKGIHDDFLSKIFDPYFSTKERGSQKGMGMGLAVSYAIVQRHDGYISVQSEPGEGTTVELYLPVYTEPEARESKKAA